MNKGRPKTKREQRKGRYKRIAWEEGAVSKPKGSIRFDPYRFSMIQRRKKIASQYKSEKRRGAIP